ncbi:hypothetical protein NUM_42890 [Actinocatenispora comari]|uniref:NB-ARC domain-containing protein n=1 Tax=Actinocatenispora comari TaxID=2807577 RepID=A0A8J4EMB5_9ACTN|nr:hypothetical protein NUM_42890 [Actinocatenispora comari]
MVSGPGGVGKTALVLRFAHLVKDRFADGQLYCDLGGWGGEPVDPAEALGAFLRALGVASERIPVGLGELTALYRSVTATKSLLVVLDNALSTAQVRVLVPASVSGVVLVTSRKRLGGLVPDGARLLEVGPLSVTDGVRLLSRAVGAARVQAEADSAREMAALCGGLPVALCVAAARLVARPRLPVGAMAGELGDERRRLEVLSLGDGDVSVEASLDLSYRSLPAAGAALYRRLALHPGREFCAGVAESVSGTRAGRTLDLLVGASLLEEIDADRFRFHDLLRLHARRRAEADDPPQLRSSVLRALVEWYVAAAMRADRVVTPYRRRLPYRFVSAVSGLPELSDRAGALAWLETERLNLIESGRVAMREGWYELAWQLADVMWPLLLYRKHRRDRLEIDKRGMAAAQAWGNRLAEAHMCKRLARICVTTGDPVAAEHHLHQAIGLYEQVGDERDRVDARAALVSLYRATGRLGEATATARAVLEANRRLDDPRSTGLALLMLAELLTHGDQPDEALGLLTQAERLFTQLDEVDPYNGVRVQTALAATLLRQGDPGRAGRAATRAADGMAWLGSDFEQAQALNLLGQAAAAQDDARAAAAAWIEARRLFDAAGAPSRAAELSRRLAGLPHQPGTQVPPIDRDQAASPEQPGHGGRR